MPTCALCENVQAAGEACDLCGHPFPAGEAVPIPVEPLEGFEATLVPAVAPPADPLPEMEPTSIDPVQVVVEAMEGLQPTEAEGVPDDGPTLRAPVTTCRYCHNPAPAEESFCPHCGMRLPVPSTAEDPGGVSGEPGLCRNCSVPVRGGSCPSCGARVAT